MTPQEAIKWADGKALTIICELEVTKSKERQKRLNEEYSALTTFKSCTESRIPQKPYYSGDGYADGELVYDYAECPVCNCDFEEDTTNWGCKYCPDCGQALDWSDEE